MLHLVNRSAIGRGRFFARPGCARRPRSVGMRTQKRIVKIRFSRVDRLRDNTKSLVLAQNGSLLARSTLHCCRIPVQITLTPVSAGLSGNAARCGGKAPDLPARSHPTVAVRLATGSAANSLRNTGQLLQLLQLIGDLR